MIASVGCSPRTRGWSLFTGGRDDREVLLLAHAGMVPGCARTPRPGSPAPRARGDGPHPHHCAAHVADCSPRTRGWSRVVSDGGGRRLLLPAHAGMVPGRSWPAPRPSPAPRARGDGPRLAGTRRASTSCSPRTRGWSQAILAAGERVQLLPAHAGMVPSTWRPGLAALPAPRARGDGPPRDIRRAWAEICSPRTRGWSGPGACRPGHRGLLPAHAGMVPARCRAGQQTASAPRARGDGPTANVREVVLRYCSPRTRGWSQDLSCLGLGVPLLPAHAGMVPARVRSRPVGVPAPRARGDGPCPVSCWSANRVCSPRTRGWSDR